MTDPVQKTNANQSLDFLFLPILLVLTFMLDEQQKTHYIFTNSFSLS